MPAVNFRFKLAADRLASACRAVCPAGIAESASKKHQHDNIPLFRGTASASTHRDAILNDGPADRSISHFSKGRGSRGHAISSPVQKDSPIVDGIPI